VKPEQYSFLPEAGFVEHKQFGEFVKAQLIAIKQQHIEHHYYEESRIYAEDAGYPEFAHIKRPAKDHIFVGEHKTAEHKEERDSVTAIEKKPEPVKGPVPMQRPVEKMTEEHNKGSYSACGIKVSEVLFGGGML